MLQLLNSTNIGGPTLIFNEEMVVDLHRLFMVDMEESLKVNVYLVLMHVLVVKRQIIRQEIFTQFLRTSEIIIDGLNLTLLKYIFYAPQTRYEQKDFPNAIIGILKGFHIDVYD